MSQITENSAALNQGADAIFNAILGMVNEQLQAELEPYAAYGISFPGLTAGGYGEQLDQLATVFTQMGASQAAGQLSAVKSQLDTVAQFRDGVKYRRCRRSSRRIPGAVPGTERALYRQ
jgi:hypothetical protein